MWARAYLKDRCSEGQKWQSVLPHRSAPLTLKMRDGSVRETVKNASDAGSVSDAVIDDIFIRHIICSSSNCTFTP